jgi:hypothetical protein
MVTLIRIKAVEVLIHNFLTGQVSYSLSDMKKHYFMIKMMFGSDFVSILR